MRFLTVLSLVVFFHSYRIDCRYKPQREKDLVDLRDYEYLPDHNGELLSARQIRTEQGKSIQGYRNIHTLPSGSIETSLYGMYISSYIM